jgi:hypothetical protein
MPHVDVYGQDHSPWVQAVLLGLHERGISHTVTTVPPRSVFLATGILMPAASIDGSAWRLDSAEILQRVGYDPVSPEDKVAILGAWQGVSHRPDRASRFWGAFSLIRDPHPSLILRLRNHYLRSFATLYFYLLIRLMVLTGKASDPENFSDQFLYWEEKLEESSDDFLGGAEPDMLDLMLFGIIQCHCSIPVPPIAALQNDPKLTRLRVWIGTMQKRFADYPHLYSGVYFEPRCSAPPSATSLEQAAFWLGSISMLIFFPITIPLILFFATRIQRSRIQG